MGRRSDKVIFADETPGIFGQCSEKKVYGKAACNMQMLAYLPR